MADIDAELSEIRDGVEKQRPRRILNPFIHLDADAPMMRKLRRMTAPLDPVERAAQAAAKARETEATEATAPTPERVIDFGTLPRKSMTDYRRELRRRDAEDEPPAEGS